jgi:uncharacterized protein (TIGR02145 family)
MSKLVIINILWLLALSFSAEYTQANFLAGVNAGQASGSYETQSGSANLPENAVQSSYTLSTDTTSKRDSTTIVVDVTNPLTGRTWMDRNLGASRVATSSNDEDAYGDLYQYARSADGHQKRNSPTKSIFDTSPDAGFFLTATVDDSFFYSILRPELNANNWEGLNGNNNPCPLGYRIPSLTEWIEEIDTWPRPLGLISAMNSMLKLPSPGSRGINGEVSYDRFYYWSSNFTGNPNDYVPYAVALVYTHPLYEYVSTQIEAANGVPIRCIKDQSATTLTPPTVITAPASEISSSSLRGIANVTEQGSTVVTERGFCYATTPDPTLDDNCVTSTGQLGVFSQMIFNLSPVTTYYLRAYATNSAGTSYGRSVEVTTSELESEWPRDITTEIVEITNPATGRTWMDRNLGASHPASNLEDEGAFGDLYQWGRAADGHEKRNSPFIDILSNTVRPEHRYYIYSYDPPFDWLITQNPSLWQGVDGENNPCPEGYRIPTRFEWDAEIVTWSSNDFNGAMDSPLKLPAAGSRYLAGVGEMGRYGRYASSTVISTNDTHMIFYDRAAGFNSGSGRVGGNSVRCIKEEPMPPVVVTASVYNILSTTVTGLGNVLSEGSNPVTNRGFCYATTPDPTTDDTCLASGSGPGEFTAAIKGLQPITTYYLRAYAINAVGTAYGREVEFTTEEFGPTWPRDTTTVVENVVNPGTGRAWMDRNLGASRRATSSTDEEAYGDLYQWGRGADGHQLRTSPTTTTLSSTDQPGHGDFILIGSSPADWRSPQNENLWQGLDGINNPCPAGHRIPTEAEWNAERATWSSSNASGAYSSVLRLPVAGTRNSNTSTLNNVGSAGTYWSSVVEFTRARTQNITDVSAATSGSSRAFGFSVRCILDETATAQILPSVVTAPVSSITTTTATGMGSVNNEGSEPVSERGVCYATTPNPSTDDTCVASGSGLGVFTSALIDLQPATTYYLRAYAINAVGTAYGREVEFTTEDDSTTEVVDVTNPTTGRVWMDRNLGASRAATSSTDADSYGDLYQWGRGADGHQLRPSPTTTTLSSTDQPGHGDFILGGNSPFDWRSPQNNTLWQGVDGTNNPCPAGYRLPTEAEWSAERTSWSSNNSAGAFASPLKLPAAGFRSRSSGSVLNVGSNGNYWSSSVSGTNAWELNFGSSGAGMGGSNRASGSSVRCLKDGFEPEVPTLGTSDVGSVTTNSAITGGEITSDGGAMVTSRGVVWSTSQNPTLESNLGVTSDGSGAGAFTSSLSGLATSTTYYVRAYATNIAGTAYGNEVSFTTSDGRDNTTQIVDVTNPTTGRVWMDRNLGASRAATSSTDADSYGDLYQWGRGADGHQLRTSPTTTTLSSTDTPDHGSFILVGNSPFDWRSPQNNTLWQGVDGTNNPCPAGYRLPTEAEWSAERTSWSSNNSAGAFASPLKLPLAGRRDSGSGALFNVGLYSYYWSSSVSGTNASLILFGNNPSLMSSNHRAFALSVRCLKDGFEPEVPTLGTSDVGSVTANSAITAGEITSDGGATVTSRGVVWSTSQNPTLESNLGVTSDGSGAGAFTSSLSGLATSTTYYVRAYATNIAGTAYGNEVSFTTSDGRDNTTQIVDVTNPTTGRVWMDRNLGASRAATSSTDADSYGDLYQWGRGADGHQLRTSPTTTTLSSTDTPDHGSFILVGNSPFDWRSPQNNTLWQGVDGTNNPCPAGYRLPTEAEWSAERTSWSSNNSAGAFASPLKLPTAGFRSRSSGSVLNVGSNGNYWSSSVSGTNAWELNFGSSGAGMGGSNRASGSSVRCLKDGFEPEVPTLGTSDVGSVTTNSAITGGEITSDGGATVTSRGVVWSTSQNPTLESNLGVTSDGSGAGAFTSSLSGLATSTTYYVRAYATNIAGTAYGNEVSFTTSDGRDNTTQIVDVTNPTTGRVWMDRNLGASRAATSSTDADSYGDLYQWGRRADGHHKRTSPTTTTLSSTDTPDHGSFILVGNSPFDWRSPQNNTLWQGVDGTNNPCPAGYRLPTEAEWNAERTSWSSNNSAGAFASPLKLPAAGFRSRSSGSVLNVGSNGNYWSSSVSGTNAWELNFGSSGAGMGGSNRASGSSVRCLKDGFEPEVPTLGTSDVGSVTTNSAITGGEITSDGGAMVTSRGVVWSTSQNPTLESNLGVTSDGSGAGAFTSSLSGLATSTTYYVRAYATNIAGTAYGNEVSFTTSDGRDNTTQIVDVINPTTGRVWMDRNLGASRAATSSTDADSYGDLYQWGRRADGHHKRTSPTTTTLSSTDTPDHGSFILVDNNPWDWRSPQNNTLWQGVDGTNNPCPAGYRLPTEAEWSAERTSWSSDNSAGAFASPLKLPAAGYRGYSYSSTSLFFVGTIGRYWSGSVLGSSARFLGYNSSEADVFGEQRALGATVRCLKDGVEPVMPTLNTSEVGSVTANSATTGGEITSDGGATVTSRGVCYSTTQNPTIFDTCVASGSGTGSFSATITGLGASVTYYVRAYATNIAGTAYGLQTSFTTAAGVPTVTVMVNGISLNGATVTGQVTFSGGSTVTGRGVCYATSQNPTTSDTCMASGSGEGAFPATLTGLGAGVLYFVRAYATNSAGTAYSNEISFTTSDGRDNTTQIVDVTNPTTGRVWMDRNLGASRAATSSTDAESLGDLYQWGRRADGHQKRNSPTTTTLSSTDTPAHGSFILVENFWDDWRTTQNNTLWQGVDGINNPCPNNYRLPTEAEWNDELNSWSSNNSAGSYASPLKLPAAGIRNATTGTLSFAGFVIWRGYYRSSSVFTSPRYLHIDSGSVFISNSGRAEGMSVRCIKEQTASIQVGQDFSTNWNLVGLPVDVEHERAEELFPTAIANTLFGFDGSYKPSATLVTGKGYWLRFAQATTQSFIGSGIDQIDVPVVSGWNLISGLSSQTVVDDMDQLVIPGTLYGFNGAYSIAASLLPARGYWIRTIAAGQLRLVNAPASFRLIPPQTDTAGFNEMVFTRNGTDRSLYFGQKLPQGSLPESYSLPPVPPSGAFDVRFDDDVWLTDRSEVTVHIQPSSEPTSVMILGNGSFSLSLWTDGLPGGQRLVMPGEVLMLPAGINRLVVRPDEAGFESSTLPAEYLLEQNFPNPFNPATAIRYALPEAGQVRLEVFTAAGQRVAVLAEGERAAGWHSATFEGGSLASGVYIYRLQAGGLVLIRKLLLVK